MTARVPLDVDLEDKLVYGLTPIRLAYMAVALVVAFTLWSFHWAPGLLRESLAAMVIVAGAAAAWGRWRGRAADDWAVDIVVFALHNYKLEWRDSWRPWPAGDAPTEGAPPADENLDRPEDPVAVAA